MTQIQHVSLPLLVTIITFERIGYIAGLDSALLCLSSQLHKISLCIWTIVTRSNFHILCVENSLMCFYKKATTENLKTKFSAPTSFLASSPLLILFGYLAMVDAAFLDRE